MGGPTNPVDPIWLDTNVVQRALDGDPAVNRQLADYRNAGRQLLVPLAVNNELLNGNVLTMKNDRPVSQQVPSVDLRNRMQTGMNRLGIGVDWSSTRVPQKQRVAYNVDVKTSVKVEESDRLVLSQIKAGAEARGVAKPQMITGEGPTKPMMTQASNWGIESVPTAKPIPGLPPYPRVNLANYPPEKKGAISKFFNDRPLLTRLGLIGLNIGAQYITDKALSQVKDHFTSEVGDAQKEFDSKYPDPGKFKARANLGRYKQAYETARSKLTAPTTARVGEAVILALTPDRDIDKVKKYADDQISKVQSAADGSMSGYAKVAQEYIDAMVAFDKQLQSTLTQGASLPEIADDVEQRGSVLKAVGDDLDNTYNKYQPYVAALPFAEYVWNDIHSAAAIFQAIGGSLLSFTSAIRDRYESYSRAIKELDNELTKVSDESYSYQ